VVRRLHSPLSPKGERGEEETPVAPPPPGAAQEKIKCLFPSPSVARGPGGFMLRPAESCRSPLYADGRYRSIRRIS
jgi:hypothetical protein